MPFSAEVRQQALKLPQRVTVAHVVATEVRCLKCITLSRKEQVAHPVIQLKIAVAYLGP